MALRLRRGIEAARTITPEQGELLYVTDTNKVYVGDGATPGGILVGPVDATLYDLLSDTTPQLGGNLDLNGRDITGTGNININGTITAKGIVNLGEQEVTLTLNNPVTVAQGDTITQLGTKANGIVKTSVSSGSTIVLIVTKLVSDFKTVAEIGTDSATLLRSNNEPLGGQPTNVSVSLADTISIGGKITSSFIPDIDDEYSIGTVDKQWANIWATQVNVDTTLAVGSQIIKLSSGSADSSLVLWDAETDTLSANTVIGNLVGSVFADDSIKLVDGLRGSLHTSAIDIEDNLIGTSNGTNVIVSDTGLEISSGLAGGNFGLTITGEGTSSGTSSSINLFCVGGTKDAPTPVEAGDVIGTISFTGFNGNTYVPSAALALFTNQTANDQFTTIDTTVALFVGNGSGSITDVGVTLSSNGVFSMPIAKVAGYATGDLPGTSGLGDSTPDEGWIVFDSTTKQFKGWNGTAWVVLG